MVIASSFFDPVMGLDTHIVNIPAPPVPIVPTPIPMPFVGMVFDPLGMAVGAAIGMATGGGPGVVMVNVMPATNCGTEVTNKLTLPHLPVPGVAFIPPPMPGNDAELYFGSNQVSLGGSFGVRLGDVALSCSDPVRLPTSVVLAIPKGMPVLNMPAMVPDLQAIAMAIAMRGVMRMLGGLARRGAAAFRRFRANSRFFQRLSRRLGGCTPPTSASRWRQMWHRGVRFVTGHPVDVVTGNLFTDVVDFELPGPLPLTFERVYESAGSGKASSLGFGWSHSLDESLWMERGRAVVRCGDGREVEFPLWDLPDRVMRPGDVVERVIHKLKLRCVDRERFEVEHASGNVHEYAPVRGGDPKIARLVRIRSRDRFHAIELSYDARGRLEWVRDSAGRLIGFEHDDRGRLVYLKLPVPHGRGWYRHREYVYDRRGDLAEVKDAAGHSWRYEYDGHLLVRETDRAGLSFYFQYDGIGSSAKCVRTWGDGGIYDHVITYDGPNKKTVVEDSLGAVTTYDFNERNQVVSITDPLGAATKYEYDPDTGGQTVEVDPMGGRNERRFDLAGNLVELVAPDGATTKIEYDGYLPVRAVDARGGEWQWRYDRGGRLVERILPSGQRVVFGWDRGVLQWAESAPGRRFSLEYDEHHNPAAITFPNGGVQRCDSDGLGRLVKLKSARDGVTRFHYDAEGRCLELHSPTEIVQQTAYDAEGNLTELRDTTKHIRLGYGHLHRVVSREEAGARVRFEYDTEDRLIGVLNEADERYRFVLDEAGNVREEIGFDGRARVYLRDKAGRVTKTLLPSGRDSENTYDAAGRVIAIKHSDGAFAQFEYDPMGVLVKAENESAKVELERDVMGRVTLERVNGHEVRSRYSPGGDRSEMTTSLGGRVAIGHDPLGGVRELFLGPETAMGPDVSFERDAVGLEKARRFRNGIDVEWSHDAAGRPTSRRTFKRSAGIAGLAAAATALAILGTPTGASAGAPSREIDARVNQWRGEDQIAAIMDPTTGPRFYDHDGRGRVVRERAADAVVERAMDATGNVFRTADGRDRRYGRGGRLEAADGVRYEHDEDGNQTRKIEPDGREWRYAWNGHGMLREVERPDGLRVQFQYDPLARRTVKRTVNTDGATQRETAFVWDDHHVVHEIDSDSGLTTWAWDPGTFVPIAKETAGRRWSIASDHLGTPSEMYDELGELAWKMQLDTFGVARFPVGDPGECPWRWPGQYDDPETGTYYNRFRVYDYREGRYVAQDPISISGGFNVFAYVVDPCTLSDPLGLAGGSYGATRSAATAAGSGGQVNHMPAFASYNGTSGAPTHYSGPAIWMTTADHMQTSTWGSSTAAQNWRATQQAHILNGRFDLAMEMDIRDVQSRFPGAYDGSMTQMLDYSRAQGQITPRQRARIRRTCGV